MRILVLIALCFSLVNCTHFSMYRNEEPSSATSEEQVIATPHYFWGLLAAKEKLVESELCPNSRIDAVRMSMTAGHVLLTIVTAGIYVPSRTTVSCSK